MASEWEFIRVGSEILKNNKSYNIKSYTMHIEPSSDRGTPNNCLG